MLLMLFCALLDGLWVEFVDASVGRNFDESGRKWNGEERELIGGDEA